MAKVTRSKTSTKSGGTATAKKETTTKASNGATRRTAEDWDSIVNEIRTARQAGETMQALKKKYSVSSDVPMREALARAGFNSKGDALEVEDISGLTGVKLKNRLIAERKEGTAWYMLSLMTGGKPESELREIVGDAAPAQVRKASTKSTEGKEEGAQAKTTVKRGGKSKAKANPSKTD